MKSVHLALCTLLLSSTLTAFASRQILPAGSLINCTVSENKLSSKTTAIGDPVLCKASMTTRNGSTRLPFNTYLEGRFEDYKDPGHFVGKGWMELKFDRLVIEPRTVIPLEARVVDVPGFAVDQKGRILGKGHATRDIVMWSIPILWPIDLLTLPGRGPRPTLKTETRLTLKVMDDTEVPVIDDPERDPSGLYRREPSAYNDAPQDQPQQQVAQEAPPQQPAYQPPPPAYQPPPQQYQQQDQYQQPQYQPPQYQQPQSYVAPAPVAAYVMPMYVAPAPVVYVYAAPPPPPVRVYMYAPPSVAMWSAPRTVVYQSPAAYRSLYGY
ncbi:hypothetical protein P8935_12900 [Telmatobacter sp. DSM 110680]|uniref:Uncharacterized protein n=1 Tax=Telmatobacter sp. DSM 110680 TaxID=3036704 RepID=A0AAU7DE99_9BACT